MRLVQTGTVAHISRVTFFTRMSDLELPVYTQRNLFQPMGKAQGKRTCSARILSFGSYPHQ